MLAISTCAVVIGNSLPLLHVGMSFVALLPFLGLLLCKFKGRLVWYIGVLAVFAALVQNDKLMYAIAAMCLHLSEQPFTYTQG